MAMIELVNRREQQLVRMRKLIALCIRTEAFPKPTVLGRLILGKCMLAGADGGQLLAQNPCTLIVA